MAEMEVGGTADASRTRRGSYFHVRRPTLPATGPSTAADEDEHVSRRLRYFCRELAAVCKTRRLFDVTGSYQCFSSGEEGSATEEHLVQNLARLRRHA